LHALRGATLFLVLFGNRALYAEPPAWTAFRNGVRAYAGRQYAAAADNLRRAVALNATESRDEVPIYGTWYEPYTPHLHLAMALVKLGRCEEARVEFAASDKQGIVPAVARNIRDYGTVKAIRDACAPPSQPQPSLTASAAERPPVTTSVATETRAPQPLPVPASVTTTQPAALAPPAAAAGANNVAASRQSLQAIIDEASRLVAMSLKSSSPRARAARAKLSFAMPAATKSLATTDVATITQAASSLKGLVNDYRTIIAELTPPPSLAEAIRAYTSGDYGRSLALLSAASTPNRSYRAQIALFSAAARHALFLLSGARDGSLERQAIRDVMRYRSLEPNGLISTRIFSPQFVAFANRNRG